MLIRLIRSPKGRPSSTNFNSITSQRLSHHDIHHTETTGIFSGSAIAECTFHSQTTGICPRAVSSGQTNPYHRSSIFGISISLRISKSNIRTTLVSSTMPRKQCAALGMLLPRKQPVKFFSRSGSKMWTPRTISILGDSVKVSRDAGITGA